jgi:hypothetical protein
MPDPDFNPSRISDTTTKEEGLKISCLTFFCSHKFHKINYFRKRKKIEPIGKEL